MKIRSQWPVKTGLSLFALIGFCAAILRPGEIPVRLVHHKDQARVDVFVGDEIFTAYHYGKDFYKPIFHPLRSSKGTIVTRQFPMQDNVPGEKHDHPHHESMWFTYGNVNGLDFWAKRLLDQGGGRIRNTGITRIEGGKQGLLETTADWVTPSGEALLKEKTLAVFRAAPGWRAIDLMVELSARGEKAVFHDTKEGMFGIRVAPDLHEDRTGVYLNASGQKKEKGVWGKKSPWVALQGAVQDEEITLAIFNHPASAGYPTYWHARAYGLFAANPFGKVDFEEGSEPINYTLHAGESAVFRYLVLIQNGKLSAEQLDKWFQDFVNGE